MMKKRVISICLVAAVAALSLAGCGSTKKSDNKYTAQDHRYYQLAKEIEQTIEETALPKGYATLLDDNADDWCIVSCKEGKVTVDIRAYMNFTIPYVAETFLPIAKEAIDNAGLELERFTVNSYNTNKDGVVKGSFANWSTKDWESGILADEMGTDLNANKGGTDIKQSMTITDLHEHYSDFSGIVEQMIKEAGGE